MVGRVYVRDLEILQNLQNKLSQFNYGTNKVLDEVASGLAEVREFLKSRTDYWNVELRKREEALRACSSKDDKDKNCSRETMAVREAKESLDRLKKLQARFEQALGEYQPHANRLQQVVSSKIGKAKGDLHRSIDKYQHYLSQMPPRSGNSNFGQGVAGIGGVPTTNSYTAPDLGITWAEKRAILKKIDDRQTISLEEMDKLMRPVTDLKAETLQEDYRWIQELLETERFRQATRSLWTAQAPTANLASVAWSLLGVGADIVKMIQFWEK